MAPYPLRTTLLLFADDMAVVTATARQPLPTTLDPTRATQVLHVVTTYLEGNQLLVHNVKSATMVHNAPPPPLRPGDLPMNPVNTATYLGVQQAATAGGVTLPPNLIGFPHCNTHSPRVDSQCAPPTVCSVEPPGCAAFSETYRTTYC